MAKTNSTYTYNPDKGFWQGIPARDLTPDEWNAIADEVKKDLLSLGLYTEAKPQTPKKEGE